MSLSNKQFKTIWVLLVSTYSIFIAYGSALPNILLGIMSSVFIYGLFTKKIQVNVNKLKWIFVFTAFYFIYVLSLMYSENLDYGIKKAKLQFILFLTPVIIISTRELLNKTETLRIIQYNIISTLAFIAISLSLAFKNWFNLSNDGVSFFTESNLSTAFVDLHFLELALLISFNIVGLIYLKINEKKALFKYLNTFFWPILFVLIFFLILLNSRTAFTATAIVVLGIVIFNGFKDKTYKKTLITLVSVGVLFFGNYTLNLDFKTKINEAFKIDNTYAETKNWGGRGMRFLIWRCSTKLIDNNPIFGVGIGDQQDELTLCYKKYRYGSLLFKNKNFNSHNIFLQSLIISGIVGFLFYFFSLVYPSFFSFKKKNNLYITFILIFILNGITESFLQVNFGVTFFSFFSAVLFNLNYNNESITNT